MSIAYATGTLGNACDSQDTVISISAEAGEAVPGFALGPGMLEKYVGKVINPLETWNVDAQFEWTPGNLNNGDYIGTIVFTMASGDVVRIPCHAIITGVVCEATTWGEPPFVVYNGDIYHATAGTGGYVLPTDTRIALSFHDGQWWQGNTPVQGVECMAAIPGDSCALTIPDVYPPTVDYMGFTYEFVSYGGNGPEYKAPGDEVFSIHLLGYLRSDPPLWSSSASGYYVRAPVTC